MPLEQTSISFPDPDKILLDRNAQAGYRCNCCGQFVKIYTRKLNSSMAQVLILIYRSGKTDYFHVEDYLKSLNKASLRADFHKLRYWGLLKKKIENREDNSPRNGFYRITPSGIMFVESKIQVKEAVLIFNNEFMGFSGNDVSIDECLGRKFSYSELMGTV